MTDRRPEIDHEVGETDSVRHVLEQFHVGLVVTVVKIAHGVVVFSKDVDAFIDGAVLYDRLFTVPYFQQILETFFQEEHLHGERPAFNVFIIIFQIGIVVHRLEPRLPSVPSGQHGREGRLAAPYVSCNCNVHKIESAWPSLFLHRERIP